jgi:peptidyl-Lys metalloendopeptidase
MSLLFVLLNLLFFLGSSQLLANLYPNPAVGPASVILEFLNESPQTMALLRWNLPLDPRFGSDSFSVHFNGLPVSYLGPVVKYAGPFLSDYVMISPNGNYTVVVNLSDDYDFSIPGKYEVEFRADIMDYIDGKNILNVLKAKREEFSPLGVVSNRLEITTHESLAPKSMRAPYPCSSTEEDDLYSAGAAQKTMSDLGHKRAVQGETPTYTEWFGAYTSGRHNTVSSCLNKVLNNNLVAYACDDQRGVYAYVYPADTTRTIYVCEAFWSASEAGGFDTRAGTLIHELSHFNALCGTRDHVYGVNGARNLARTDPSRAVANADNFEYFCESLW